MTTAKDSGMNTNDQDWRTHAIAWLLRRAEKFRAAGGGDSLEAAITCEELADELEHEAAGAAFDSTNG